MTKTKLEIIGPYTPDHEGPFCTRDGRPVRVLCSDMQNDYNIVAIVADADGKETVSTFLSGGRFSATGCDSDRDLMNAREVPVPREFWVNEYERSNGDGTWFGTFTKKEIASINKTDSYIRTIHVREVPVAREFWVNKYKFRELSAAYPTKGMADSFSGRDRVECIHVREVLPGDDQ